MSKSTTMANMTTLSRELPLSRGSPALQSRALSLGGHCESLLSSNQSGKGSDNEESTAETSLQISSQQVQEAELSRNYTSPPLKDSRIDFDSPSLDVSKRTGIEQEAKHVEAKGHLQSESGASNDISQPMSSQADHHAKHQPVGLSTSLDHSHGQDLYMQSLPSCTTESEPRRIRAFAKLEFDDGQFYMNTYSVELGRDRRAAGRANMEAGLLSRKGSSLGDIPPFIDHVRNISSSSVGYAQLSDSGGIVAHEGLEKKHVTRRKKSKKSMSTSSSSRRVSRKNSFIYPEVQTDYPPLTVLSPGDTTSKAPPDISTLLPPPSECPFVPIQPPNGARHQVISRQHLKINYNPEKQGFDMLVIGRNGAFHDGEWRAPGEEQSLHDGSIIQIGGTQIKFILPEVERNVLRESNEDSVSEKMSFQFENDQGERITVSSSESSEIEAMDNINLNYVSSGSDADNSSNEDVVDVDQEDEDESGGEEEEIQEESGGDEEEDEGNEEGEEEESEYPTSQWQKLKEKKMVYTTDLVEERVRTRAMRRQSKFTKPFATNSRAEAKIPRKLRLTMPSKDPRIRVTASKGSNNLAVSEKNGKSSKQRKDYDIETEKSEVKRDIEKANSNAEQLRSKTDDRSQAQVTDSNIDSTNATQEHPYLDLPPGVVIPPRRKGPGRPPKDGFMSKREKALLIRQAKEAEKSRKMGLEPGQFPTSVAKFPAEKRKYTKRRLEDGSTQNDARADHETGSDLELQNDLPQDELKSLKPSQPARSPSPEMKETDYTDEQLQRPNANYVILIHEAIKDSKSGEMNLQQIYHAIERRYPFYRFKVSTTGWQSSVRHNLQQNEAFIKVRREGKGYVWGVNPNVTVEKEKRKRVTPPPQHRSYYHGYPPTRPYGLQQSALASQQGLHVSQSQSPYSSAQILLPTHLPGASRTSTYSSPYAPLSRSQPQPSGIQQLHHINSGQNPLHTSQYGQTGLSSSLLAQKSTPGTLPGNLPSSTSNTLHNLRQSGTEPDSLTNRIAAASNSVSLLSSRISSGKSTSQSQPINPSLPKASGLKHLPPNSLATVMADFRQRFLGANEQSARSESIIDPIIRRFTHPKEAHDSPKPHENIIIRIIEGMLKEMHLNKTEGDMQKSLVPKEKTEDTELGNSSKGQASAQNHADRAEASDQEHSSQKNDKPGDRPLGAQVEKKETSQEVSTTVANGLLDSLASAAAASSANIVKSTPSHVVTAPTDLEPNSSSATLRDTIETKKSDASKAEPVASERPEGLSGNVVAGSEHRPDVTKGPKRSIDEVNGQAGEAGSDPDEKIGESKRVRP